MTTPDDTVAGKSPSQRTTVGAKARCAESLAWKSNSRVGETLVLLMIPGLLLLDLANGLIGAGKGIAGSLVTPGDLGRGVLLIVGLASVLTIRGRYLRDLQRWLLALSCLGLIGPASALFGPD